MTLHFYFARRFLWTFLGLLAVFFLFLGFLDLVEQLRRYDDVGFASVLHLTFLNIPASLYEMLPLVMILSSIALFLSLARSSELVVARAAGRSGMAALAGPGLVALFIGLIALAAVNPIVAGTQTRYFDLRESFENGGNVVSIGREGLWLRQGDAEGQTVIRASRASPDAGVLYDVSFLSYDASGPTTRIQAGEARLGDGAWQLRDVKIWPLTDVPNPEAQARLEETLELPSTLTQDDITERFGRPSSVSIWNLPGFITGLESAGFSAQRYIVWMQMELAKPVFLLALMLVGAAFTMRHARLGRTGLSVLTAVLLGFGLYYVRNFAQILGENGQIDPIIAAWIPPVASLTLAAGVILQREDG